MADDDIVERQWWCAGHRRLVQPGRVTFVLGLANDEMGYIIPRSEWDQAPPYLYDAAKRRMEKSIHSAPTPRRASTRPSPSSAPRYASVMSRKGLDT
jgi:hypothetical protein